MSDPITATISQRICKHMNEDHGDAVLLYAQVYGQATAATQARMVQIDPEGMDLMAQVHDQAQSLRVQFDHVLQDSEDAHQTLIAMVRAARTQGATT
ncbi:DUF2470 domain-containing protein [Synechococcales cyanobacterium C]|uniref:DUF2470 domain-containing protein n=1 Tax=Petrachloros mirabilis ULC683 TaxID=2781853 RepID=A0A8K1ZZM9_9CYAN|nr:DUF2470 domain-containing protein [Petrachloros mirabilis]NCJ07051.1 DUF2470 domain-containing protein [Petrachloros mirabilis ULC683]